MTEKEKYLKLKGDRSSLGSRLANLPRDLEAQKAEISPLEDEACRMEILGDPAAGSKRIAVQKITERIRSLEFELEEGKKRIKITDQILTEIRKKAEAEIFSAHEKAFKQSLEVFISKVQDAFKAEVDLAKTRDQVTAAFNEIDSSLYPNMRWDPLFMAGSWDPRMKPFLENAVIQLKALRQSLS